MNFDLGLYGHLSRDVIWVRWRPSLNGFALKRTEPLFSERTGKAPTLRLPFGWRIVRLLLKADSGVHGSKTDA